MIPPNSTLVFEVRQGVAGCSRQSARVGQAAPAAAVSGRPGRGGPPRAVGGGTPPPPRRTPWGVVGRLRQVVTLRNDGAEPLTMRLGWGPAGGAAGHAVGPGRRCWPPGTKAGAGQCGANADLRRDDAWLPRVAEPNGMRLMQSPFNNPRASPCATSASSKCRGARPLPVAEPIILHSASRIHSHTFFVYDPELKVSRCCCWTRLQTPALTTCRPATAPSRALSTLAAQCTCIRMLITLPERRCGGPLRWAALPGLGLDRGLRPFPAPTGS